MRNKYSEFWAAVFSVGLIVMFVSLLSIFCSRTLKVGPNRHVCSFGHTHPQFLFLSRQNSLWPRWPKTFLSATRWPRPQSPWWTAARSGCRPTCPSQQPFARASRPSTTATPRRDRVGPLNCRTAQAPCCLGMLWLGVLTEGFLMVSCANCGKFSTCEIMCVWCACGRVVCPAVVRISPCHSRQPSVISDASAADGDRSSTPSDINSPRHRTHSLCNVRAAWPPRPSNHTSTLFPK